MNYTPFCVMEKPYAYWGRDVASENLRFIHTIDGMLYFRTAQLLLNALPDSENGGQADVEGEKDISSLARLLWHQGVETLIMLLGALIQAPNAVKGYFLKCQTGDARSLANLLFKEQLPKYHRVTGPVFSIKSMLAGIYQWTSWEDAEMIIERHSLALKRMLSDFRDPKQNFEYNAIKHGLRASHGKFSLAFGLEEKPGVLAPGETMKTIGSAKNSSHFDVVKPIKNVNKGQAKINFATEGTTVAWSLERVLSELQILSFLISNTASALKIINGTKPQEVQFHRQIDGEDFWELYPTLSAGTLHNATFGVNINGDDFHLYTAEEVFESYLPSKSD